MLDDAGWPDCKITVSNALDERLIAGLLRQGAQIDSFGVGERLITARSEPVFGGVYKLAAVEDENGNIIPKIKISENVGKITNPHFKKVYRFYSKDYRHGRGGLHLPARRGRGRHAAARDLRPRRDVEEKGAHRLHGARAARAHLPRRQSSCIRSPRSMTSAPTARRQLATLWPEVLRFDYPHNYYVDLSEKLLKIKLDLLNAGGKSQG